MGNASTIVYETELQDSAVVTGNTDEACKTLGQVGYESYSAATGNKTFTGADMPKWEDITPRIQDAWNKAALGVLSYVNKAQEELRKG